MFGVMKASWWNVKEGKQRQELIWNYQQLKLLSGSGGCSSSLHTQLCDKAAVSEAGPHVQSLRGDAPPLTRTHQLQFYVTQVSQSRG